MPGVGLEALDVLALMETPPTAHTYGPRCLLCPAEHGKPSADGWSLVYPPGKCIHGRYLRRYLAFVKAHLEAFQTAVFNPDPRASANEFERLAAELANLPTRHICTCPGRDTSNPHRRYGCPWEDLAKAQPACPICRKRRAAAVRQDLPIQIGRTAAVRAPIPGGQAGVFWFDLQAGLLRRA